MNVKYQPYCQISCTVMFPLPRLQHIKLRLGVEYRLDDIFQKL